MWLFVVYELELSVNQYSYEHAAAILKEFLNAGLNINKILDDGCTPLTTAIRAPSSKVVRLLIEYGADVNVCCGHTAPITHALLCGNHNMVSYLLAHGAEIGGDKETWDGSLLETAIALYPDGNFFKEIINLLLDRYNTLGRLCHYDHEAWVSYIPESLW